MFKSEKIFLFLLISVCLIISVVLIDASMDPGVLLRTAYARFSGSPEPALGDVYIPDLVEAGEGQLLGESSELSQEGWNVFKSEGYAFEIQYPNQVVKKSILNQDALNAGLGIKPEAPVWQFRLDNNDLYQGTNLVDASVLIHVLEGKEQEAACNTFKPGSIYQTPSQQRSNLIETEINGTPFFKDEVIEGVMGEFYHRISYRTYAKGACYEITQLVHYQNIDSITDEKVVEFDWDQVVSELDSVVYTFSLLDVAPTFPEQSYPVPKALSTAVSKATSGNVDGLDVSHWQGTINWTKVRNAGYVFTFAKGTEGVGWTDVKFHENMVNGTNAGVMMGVYHFARPDLGNSAKDEANHFVDVAGEYLHSGYLRPVLDLEVGSSLGKTKLSNWVLEWMQTVENKTGIKPLIYANPNYINYYLTEAITEYDLWVAHWTCVPNPSYYYPNTGMWRDWAFWQYYGPGGCGGNAGYVPGIQTNIDLNIFNGVESGLQAYDAATTQVWVSLISDIYYAPTPYFADILGNVNGDYTGLIDFSFWWDCDALETDVGVVEGICGELPEPEDGTCLKNDVGMKCLGMTDDLQLAEHTYFHVGNYTAKVIAEIGENAPVEDRYKITTYNPIRSVNLTPASPVEGQAGGEFNLNGKVEIKTVVSGALQLSVEDPVTQEVFASECLPVGNDQQITKEFSLGLSESGEGDIVYQVYARYRHWQSCPIEDQDDDDISKLYTIQWIDEKAYLEFQTEEGEIVSDGDVVDLGAVSPFQAIELGYLITNPSTTNSFQVSTVDFQNINNVANLQFEPTSPIEVGPEGATPFSVSFEVPSSGDFSFEVVLNHDASNPTPFSFVVQGVGVLSSNPIQSIDAVPPSPGENLIGNGYNLHVDVDLNPPVEGVLQVEIKDQEGDPVADSACVEVPVAAQDIYGFDFTWLDESSGQKEYKIWARYREYGTCPVVDSNEYDVSQGYQVDWQEDNPVLELLNPEDTPILMRENDSVGDEPPYQVFEREYRIVNPSTTTSFQITDVNFSSIENLAQIVSLTTLPLEIDPQGQVLLVLQYEIEDPGEFTADVNFEHTASNPTPYTFTLQGTGVLNSNPVQSITPQPLSSGQVLINESFGLQIAVTVDAPVEGALQITVTRNDGSTVEVPFCQEAPEGSGLYIYDLSWTESEVALKDYEIAAVFYSRSECPVSGSPIGELVLDYQVDWGEELPELEVFNQGGSLISSGGSVSLGQYEYYQSVNLSYQLQNTSSTSQLEITDIRFENLVNLDQVDLGTDSTLVLDPGQNTNLDFSLLVDLTGDFSFDLVIVHNGSNQSPYRITFQGSGIMTDNPIKYVLPAKSSPGTSLIGTPYSLDVEVGLGVPDQGALQVSLIEKASGLVSDSSCQNLIDNLDQARTLSLVLNQSTPGTREYNLLAKYRAQGSCPIEDSQDSDLSQSYVVIWEEEIPSLEIVKDDGSNLPAGLMDDIGEQEFYQQVSLSYTLRNTSNTTNLEINALSAENPIHIEQVSINPAGPFTLSPGESREITLTFLVADINTFSLDMAIVHSGENPSPYGYTVAGTGVLSANPIQSLTITPPAPGSSYITEEYAVQAQVEIDPPAPGILGIALSHQGSSALMGQSCFEILGEHSFVDLDLIWEEANPGDLIYDIEVSYQALGSCPLDGEPDAELTESYQVIWKTHQPELIVNRPEGVTIFDGAVDYIGTHDFFRFVEVTYLISNETNDLPLIINSITPDNLVNLREVIIEPSGVIEIQPGEAREIKISFQVLTLDSYSFDLVWEHNGSNQSPYVTGIMGDSNLDLGDAPEESWLYRFLESLIKSGFFLKLPIFGLFLVRRKKSHS